MKYFQELFKKIKTTVLINPSDSDLLKAQKIIWYSFSGAVVLLLIVSWIIFMIFTISTDMVKVPVIEGDNIYTALKKLYDKKLIPNATTKFTDAYESEKVFSQNPKKGAIVRRRSIVSFSVSLGARLESLPDFSGFTLFELEDYFNQRYQGKKVPFKIENPVYEYNENSEKGKIFKQEPQDGIPIYNVKSLKLWISNGLKDEKVKSIKNYLGRNIDEVSKELADLEIYYGYEFVPVLNKDDDLKIIDQSIGEGMPVDEIIEEGKVLTLKVNLYQKINGEKIRGTYLLEIPKKPVPYNLELKIRTNNKEKSILKRVIKGGVVLPVPYSAKKTSTLVVYIDNKYFKEIEILGENDNAEE